MMIPMLRFYLDKMFGTFSHNIWFNRGGQTADHLIGHLDLTCLLFLFQTVFYIFEETYGSQVTFYKNKIILEYYLFLSITISSVNNNLLLTIQDS